MKRLLAIALLVAVGSAVAQRTIDRVDVRSDGYLPPSATSLHVPAGLQGASFAGENRDRTQAVNFTTLFRLEYLNPYFSYFFPSITPLCYEPLSGILGMVEHIPTYNPQLQTWSTTLTFRYSTNLGSAWTRKTFTSTTTALLGMPQIGLSNPMQSTTADELKVVMTAYYYPQQSGYQRRGSQFFARISSTEVYTYDQNGPVDNNSNGYLFGAGKFASYSAGADRSGFAYCGVLSPPNDNVQYGQYGSLVINARLSDPEDFYGTIPSAWDNTQFRAAPQRTSTYNSPMYVDADQDGNLYAVINAIFADDENNRVVAFSKSTDVGHTWSNFQRMPVSVLQAYATNRGAAAAVPFRPYDQHALVVTGADRFSYIQRIALYADQQTLAGVDLVETEYNNGNWTMRLIAPIRDIPVVYSYNDSATAAKNYQYLVCGELISPAGNEIEVARTADGSALVVKWIDARPTLDSIVINPPQTAIRYDQQTGQPIGEIQVTSVPVFNIYLASRRLSDDAWSQPKNLTEDQTFYKGTHIPTVVPSLDRIPMLVMKSVPPTYWNQQSNAGRLLANAPQDFVSRIFNIPHDIAYATVSGVLSAESEPTASVATLRVSPLPASDVIEVAYSAPVQNATLVVLNALGQTVLVKDAVSGDGVHGTTLDVRALPAGTYVLQLRSAHGILATAPIVVVR